MRQELYMICRHSWLFMPKRPNRTDGCSTGQRPLSISMAPPQWFFFHVVRTLCGTLLFATILEWDIIQTVTVALKNNEKRAAQCMGARQASLHAIATLLLLRDNTTLCTIDNYTIRDFTASHVPRQ